VKTNDPSSFGLLNSHRALTLSLCLAGALFLLHTNARAMDGETPAKAPMQWTTAYPGTVAGEWFPRPLPLTDLPITRTIKASDFGAVPDDGQCDVKAISAAIKALRDAPGTKLVFEKGTYDLITGHDPSGEFDPGLYDSALDKAIFELVGLRDVQIDFGGSLMLVARPQATFMMVSECENVIVENFELDYATQPYTIGTIVALDAAPGSLAFDFEVHEGYLLPDDRFFLDYLEDPERTDQPTTRTWGYVIDPAHPGRLKAGTQNVFFPEKVEKIGDRTFRYHVTYPNPAGRAALNLNGVEIGDIFTYLARGGGGFIFRHTDQFTVRNATFYSNGGANFQGTFSNCLNFLGVHIKVKEGRWKTSNADGFIFHSLRYGPWIEDCTTEGMADDTVNVHIRPHFIQEVVDARTLRLGRAFGAGRVFHPKNFSAGDRASFFDGASGRVIFEAVATAVEIAGDEGLVTFDRDLPELKPGDDKLASTTVYNVDRSIGTVVRNNRFGSARRHGVLIRSEDALIENNHFEGLSSDAINFSNESGWPEGLFARNALIRNNTIKNCGFEQNYMRGETRANITIHSSRAPNPPEGVITHRDIVIEDNTIDGWYRRAVFLAHSGNVLIRNNTFGEPIAPMDPNVPNEGVIVLQHCEDVTITDNTFPPGVPDILK